MCSITRAGLVCFFTAVVLVVVTGLATGATGLGAGSAGLVGVVVLSLAVTGLAVTVDVGAG